MKRIIRSVAMAMRNSIQIRWALFETHERKLMETAGPDLEETAEAAVSQEVGVLAERGGVEEAVGGKERKGSQEKVDDVMDEREVETVRAEVPSVVDTAAPTDAVKEEGSPTAHHPLVCNSVFLNTCMPRYRYIGATYNVCVFPSQSLTWCFGFTHTLPVHNVSNNSRKVGFVKTKIYKHNTNFLNKQLYCLYVQCTSIRVCFDAVCCPACIYADGVLCQQPHWSAVRL